MSGGGRKPAGEEAEVEALLRAAQDAVLLKLQANSHLVSSSSNLPPPAAAPIDSAPGALDDDLARRFDALKSRPPAPEKHSKTPALDEAEARFAALKGAPAAVGPERVRLEDLGDGESEDEVEKVMRWAMDAARLDVATAGAGRAEGEDEEREDDRSSVGGSEEDEEERLELEMEKKRKEMMTSSKNKSKNRWFFF